MEWGVNDRYEVGCNEGSECSISSRVLIHLPAKMNIALASSLCANSWS